MSRRPISVGIQPQIALYSVILGSVCAFGWYTEKYRRDEGELDEQIQKMYLRNAQEAQSKMPQMTATIKGQSMDLDGRMDKLVWGGKAQLKSGGNNSALAAMAEESSNGDSDDSTVPSSEEKKIRKKRKKRKRKKQSEEKSKSKESTEQQQRNLVLKSSIAGVAVGAVAVAAVSVLMGGVSGGKK
mmetsp:Transcript_19920/g.49574  ORF Transcript_19920/g.49574 Transcript_19920/m.49574 type:complete len:185 (-) Transcript_19920:228-782(-)